LQFGGYIDHTRHMWPSDRLADGSNIVVTSLTKDELTAKIVPPALAASHAKGVAGRVGFPRPRVTSASAP
jgi:hypothetical protein